MKNKISSILDFSMPSLDPALWGQDMHLYVYQKDFILRLIDKMYETYNLREHEKWVDDIVILGSITTSKWLSTCDIDVHIRVNLDEFIKTNMPDVSKEVSFEFLDKTRKEFDRAKILLPMTQHPAEFYFEDLELHPSDVELVGVYSLYKNEWIKQPVLFPAEIDFEESKKKVVDEAEELAKELDGSFGEIKRDINRIQELENVIKAWGPDKQKLFYKKIEEKLNRIEEEIKKDNEIKQDLVDERHERQSATSDTEIYFKYLSRNGFFKILQELKAIVGDDWEVTEQDLPLIEKVISEASLTKESVNRAAASWIDPNGKAYYLDDSDSATHFDWIFEHRELLEQEYGYSDLDSYIEELEEVSNDVNHVDNYLTLKGWSRIGDTSKSEFGIEVYDISGIPQGLITYLISMPWDDKLDFYIEGTSGSYIQVNLGELRTEGQKAVNRALSHKRLQTAFIKEAKRYLKAWWIGPDSKVYDSGESHSAWVKSNIKLLEKNYGYNMKNVSAGFEQLSLIEKGWVRVGALLFGSMGVELQDLRKVPSYVFDFLMSNSNGIDSIVFEGSNNHREVFITTDQLPEGQKAINRVLSNKPLQSSIKQSFIKEAFTSEEDFKKDMNSIFVDFDDTICKENPDHSIGEPIQGAKEGLLKLKELGYTIVINSHRCNTEEGCKEVMDTMEKYNLPYDEIYEGQKPLAFRYIDDRAIQMTTWDKVLKEVEKAQKTASLRITAYTYNYRSEKLWIDPSGYWHKVGGSGSHADWVIDNAQLLKDEFGFDSFGWVRDNYGDIKDFVGLDQALIKTGWVRVGDTGSGWGIEVKDLHNIPNFIRDMLIGNKGEVTFEDVYGNWVIVDINEFVTQGQKAVNKALQKGRLQSAFCKKEFNKIAASRYWIDPNGKIYPVGYTHEDWIIDNDRLLADTYQLWKRHSEELYPEEIDNVNRIIPKMLQDGWSRVGDLFGRQRSNLGQGIEIADLGNIPKSTFDFISNWGKDKYFMIEDLRKRWVELSVEELMADGQEAVNRALQRGKMVHASLPVIAYDKKIFQDPTRQQADQLLANSKDKMLRWGIANGHLYMWDAWDLEHMQARNILGVDWGTDDSGYYTLSFTPQLLGQFWQVKEKNLIHASLSQKYWLDPSGKEFEVGPEGHIGWVITNILHKPITNEAIGYDEADDLIRQGWTRITTESDYDFAMEVNDINNLPGYLDSFIAQHYTSGGIEIDDLSGEYQDIEDPFPSIQKQVNRARTLRRQPVNAKVFSKKEIKAAFNPYDDPKLKQGPPYAVYRFTQKGLPELGIADIEMYDILGDHPRFGSTVGRKELETLGIPIKQEKIAQVGSPYDFSSTQFNLPKELSEKIIRWAVENIKESEIVHDEIDTETKGIQLESHITLKYGLLTDNFEEVKKALEGEKAPKIKFGKTSFFEPKGKDYDVVVIEVESEDLQKLNEKLCNAIKHEDPQGSEYHPHVTVVYVRRGTAGKYADKDILNGEEISLNELIFSPKKGEKSTLELGKNDKTASGNNFFPSLFQAPNNEQQFQNGGPDQEIALNPNSVNDETTWYSPCTEGKPRSPEVWRQFISLFQKPISKKEIGKESIYDPDLEEAEAKAMGEEPLLEYSKGFYDPKDHDFPHNTTWDPIYQDGEPYKPGMPVTYSPESNPEFDKQNSPDGFPWRFTRKPRGEWFSDEGEIVPALENMWKNRESVINSLTREITASEFTEKAFWVDPNGKFYTVRKAGESFVHREWVSGNAEILKKNYGLDITNKDEYDAMYDAGWIRIGDSFGSGYGIESNDPYHLPPSVIDWIWNNIPKGLVTIYNTNSHKSISFRMPVDNIQETINQEFKQSVMAKQESIIGKITKNITASWEGGWIDPFGQFYKTNDHEHFIKSNPSMFDLTEDDLYDLNDQGIFDAAYSVGWTRVKNFGNNLLVEALKMRYAENADSFIHENLDSGIQVIELVLEEENKQYSAYVEDFKKDGWSAFSKNPPVEALAPYDERKIAKQAGNQSASVPDYLMNEWKTDQINDDIDEEPYVNHQERDYPYGFQDAPQDTRNFEWAKDITPYVVRLDILQKPFDRYYPAGMPDYSVVFYDSLPASDGIEKANP